MNLKVNDFLPVSIVAEDEFGNPTGALDGAPAWSMSDSTLGTVEASEDGMSATVKPSGKLGTCQLQVLAAAQGKQISGSLELVMIAGDASQIVIQAGTAFDPTPAEPTPSEPAPTETPPAEQPA